MDYTIITAWYDVRERENHPQKDDTSNKFFCSMDWYFDSAKQLFNKPFPMVIFTEPRFKDLILQSRPPELHDQTKFIFRSYEELFYYDLFVKYQENHQKNPIHNVTQEKFTALYKFIVNQKVNFVKEVVEMNPFQSNKFAWMDMRLHCVYDMDTDETTEIMNQLPIDKVRLMQMCYTDPVKDRREFYAYTRGKVAAGFFGGYREPLLRFCNLCQKEFIQAVEEETAPTDEMIYSFVISNHPYLFDLYVGEYCDCLRNQLRIRNSLHLVFPFYQYAFDRGMFHYVTALSKRMRCGYIANDIQFTDDQIHITWERAYIAHRELQQHRKSRELMNEYFDIADQREDVADYIRARKHEIRLILSDPLLIERMESI